MITLSIAEDRMSLIDILLLADDDLTAIENYLQLGILYEVKLDDKLIGAALLIQKTKDILEIKNIALNEEIQGKGIGKKVIEKIVKIAHDSKSKILEVGTANSSIGNLIFYQKCGFRMVDIKRHYFVQYQPPIVENGIRGLDFVLFKMDLIN